MFTKKPFRLTKLRFIKSPSGPLGDIDGLGLKNLGIYQVKIPIKLLEMMKFI